MNRVLVPASLWLALAAARAADVSAPVDYTNRNATYAPAATVPAAVTRPAPSGAFADQRITPERLEKKRSALGDARAAIDVEEVRPKTVQQPDVRRPDATLPARSTFDHREAQFSTRMAQQPALVAKYQDSLQAASTTNMNRLGPQDGVLTAKVNRFVFRKNPSGETVQADAARVTPVAGGSNVERR